MEEGLKKRLVGAAVLASLAVIFVPMLIEEPELPDSEFNQIPPAPESMPFASSMLQDEVVRPQPVSIDLNAEPETPEAPATVAATPTPAAPAQAAAPADAPASAVVEPQAGLSAWVVQVGSFSSEENAKALVKKLRAGGFQTPDPERIELRGKVLYRVQVGPMVNKSKADKLLPQIDKLSGTKGKVLRYR